MASDWWTISTSGNHGSLWRFPRRDELALDLMKRYARTLPLVALFCSSCSAVETTSADRFTRSGELIALSGGDAGAINACFTCHGLDGAGDGAGTPRLAGLDAGYLAAQLDAYADGRRRNPEMHAIAKRLSFRERVAVSGFYASMPYENRAVAWTREPPKLYRHGDPRRGLQACADCHGVQGQGVGMGNPPLAGQPAPYLTEQIEQWRLGERRSDPGNIMQHISRRLTPAEAAVLADYAHTLGGDPRRPALPATFRAGHRADSRSDVSAPRPHEAARPPAG